MPGVTRLTCDRTGIKTPVSCLPAQGHTSCVLPPSHFGPCEKSGSCPLCLLLPTNSHFLSLPGSPSPRVMNSAARGPAQGVWGRAPAPTIGNPPAEPPSFLLKSALEFLCSQCISLEGCPPRVAMVTILVLHARKSRGTCWSHHQNLSL